MALQGKAVVVGICRAGRTGRRTSNDRSCSSVQCRTIRCPGNHRILWMGALVTTGSKYRCAGKTVRSGNHDQMGWSPCVARSGYWRPGISTPEMRRIKNDRARQSALTRSLKMRSRYPFRAIANLITTQSHLEKQDWSTLILIDINVD